MAEACNSMPRNDVCSNLAVLLVPVPSETVLILERTLKMHQLSVMKAEWASWES